ncbi:MULTISPECIES: Bax inhibitor-1/YccA family protein [unclassified Thalassotalea]|uniref:Bax inhibitor-1/YccA family protein n=1 Tax=unclassified Thalassotalea TaxID=2614972 RepID=UPI001080E218|nr:MULTISPECIES: Bax inhibitor-1/YccA family protein [unclassified Thalassotalea]NMP15374.1 Bax inhibitor-1/YccA family protein [Thalassotalea sp. Y01]QBY05977.1 Bax inhibitor-1/YccA family protein [Thalassotalea sp. HSM 43]
MQSQMGFSTATQSSAIEINKVLRNTYTLLGMTLVFSAAVAMLTIMLNLPSPGLIVTLIGVYGLMFLTYKTANSSMGILSVFAFTGFLGYTIAPLVGYAVGAGAGDLVVFSLGATGLIFFGLSAYVLTTKKDMSFLTGMLNVGFWFLLIAIVANLFFQIPAMSLAISALFILFSSAIILYQTSEIIHGGERNYILATVTLFVSLYNIFSSLLHILLAFAGGDD